MTKQEKLIGYHPDDSKQIGKWLSSNDIPPSGTKCHRELKEANAQDDELIEWMARKLIDHHYTDFRLKQLKEKFGRLGYAKYAEQHKKLPSVDKVKKGNAMVDLFEEKGIEKIRIYLGEAKFRKTPSKKVVQDITNSLSKDTLPLSYTFLVEETAKSDEPLAEKLDDYIVQDIKDKGDLIYTGLLLSNEKTSEKVEEHLDSDNGNLVFISIGIDKPEEFINTAFAKAEELISRPDEL